MHPARTRRRSLRHAKAEAGFSLLEVLVAVVVLSFGVLGVVGLQAASLQANKQAKYQSTAVRLGRELGDMMRGNRAEVLTSGNAYLVDFSGTTAPVALTNCYLTQCTSAASLARFQMSDWLSRMAVELPGAHVVVCPDDNPYDSSGLPQWNCTGSSTGVFAIKIGWTRDSFNHGANGPALDQGVRPGVVMSLIP